MSNLAIPTVLLIEGLTCVIGSIFADRLGLDPNATWGRTRIALLLFGLVMIFVSLQSLVSKGRLAILLKPFMESENNKIIIILGHLWVVIILIYAWFVTYGNFTTWNHTSHYYSRLADAFAKGQLYVDLNPGRAILDAPNPYDPKSRQPFQDEIWDMSYYDERLYYYWGPVPALISTPLQSILGRKISDNYLVFFFSVGIFIFNSLIIMKLWRSFFPQIRFWNVFSMIVLAGLMLPILWDISVPYIYEAAIAASQFFLIGGIYFSLAALGGGGLPFRSGRLFLAGLFWACSVGSRAINSLSVVFLALFISYWIFKIEAGSVQRMRYVRAMSGLYIPLIIGALAIGWYNWARFDSPLEFGLRYQITTFNLNDRFNLVFHRDYFFLNLYAYLFQPFEFISKFPFIQPVVFSSVLNNMGIAPPGLYYAGRVTGIISGTPFLLLGLIPLVYRGNLAGRQIGQIDRQRYHNIILILAGTFLIGFLTILFYFTAQTRFLVDITSQITLLAILGYWAVVSNAQPPHSARSKLLLAAANLLILFTICASFLLAVSSETNRLETLNPLLFEKINTALGR